MAKTYYISNSAYAMTSPEKKRKKLNRNAMNMIRTTQRNNIDLKHIADNKANILMSINALMITFLIPIVFANFALIIEKLFYIPLIILAISCVITLIIAAIVLRPFSTNNRFRDANLNAENRSPFFFENSNDYTKQEYHDYFVEVVEDDKRVMKYAVQDLHYFSRILAVKYQQIRWAYMVFIIGLLLSLASFALVLMI